MLTLLLLLTAERKPPKRPDEDIPGRSAAGVVFTEWPVTKVSSANAPAGVGGSKFKNTR